MKSKNREENNGNNETSEFETIKIELQSELSFDKQLEKFMNLIQLDEKELAIRTESVCNSIVNILKCSFPTGRAVPFGSSITGLAMKGSDLDIFFDIDMPIFDNDDELKTIPQYCKRKFWTPKSILRQVKSLLYKNRPIITKIIPIPHAKTPIIKFHHVPTNTDVDISFKNGFGAFNSKMIKFCLNFDSRIKPLIMIIKYWGQKLELTGSGRITNYSIVMMIFFYLQQADISLVPIIKNLQSSCEPVIYKGWLISFNSNYPKTTDNCLKTIPELLRGFFEFYAKFNYATNVICPFDGTAPTRSDFKKIIENEGCIYDSPQLESSAFLQDPIQLNHNTIGNWNARLLQSFVTACNEAVGMFDSLTSESNNLLLTLFNSSLKQKYKKTKTVCFDILSRSSHGFELFKGSEADGDMQNKDELIANQWFALINKLLIIILEKVFMLETQMVCDATNRLKQIKIQEHDDVHTNDQNKRTFTCSGIYCLSLPRKKRLEKFDPNLSSIEREILISQSILKELIEKNQQNKVSFLCSVEKKMNPLRAVITMTDRQFSNKSFNMITSFLRGKIPSLINEEVKHTVASKKQTLNNL